MSNIVVRLATAEDLDHMVAVEIAAAQLFPLEVLPADVGRSGSREEARDAIAASLAWVAQAHDAGLVGFVIAKAVARYLHIVEIDVLPSYSRQGIGGRLLEHACTHAARQSFAALTLTTFEHVPWNAPFYAKHGFSVPADIQNFAHLQQALTREQARGLRNRVAMVRSAAGGV